MKFLRLLLPVVMVVAGCSPVREQLNAWQGARLDQLIEQAGPPSSVSADMAGNRFYHWHEDRGGVYTYSGPVNLKCERVFGVDDQEIITSFTWSGNCVAIPDSPWQRLPQGKEQGE